MWCCSEYLDAFWQDTFSVGLVLHNFILTHIVHPQPPSYMSYVLPVSSDTLDFNKIQKSMDDY